MSFPRQFVPLTMMLKTGIDFNEKKPFSFLICENVVDAIYLLSKFKQSEFPLVQGIKRRICFHQKTTLKRVKVVILITICHSSK